MPKSRSFKQTMRPLQITAAMCLTMTSYQSFADADALSGWSIVPSFSFSQMSDQSAAIAGTGSIDGSYDVALDSGFAAGLGLRYRYNRQWESEFGWEYRSNDVELTPATGDALTGGNYASNIFFLNARRYFETSSAWSPYIGAGLQLIQEVDIDYETGGVERSFEDKGGVGGQVMLGVTRELTNQLSLAAELRYGSISGLTLSSEEGAGSIGKLDYNPTTLQLGLAWKF